MRQWQTEKTDTNRDRQTEREAREPTVSRQALEAVVVLVLCRLFQNVSIPARLEFHPRPVETRPAVTLVPASLEAPPGPVLALHTVMSHLYPPLWKPHPDHYRNSILHQPKIHQPTNNSARTCCTHTAPLPRPPPPPPLDHHSHAHTHKDGSPLPPHPTPLLTLCDWHDVKIQLIRTNQLANLREAIQNICVTSE